MSGVNAHRILVDTGVFVAWLNNDDRYNVEATYFLQRNWGSLVTTLPVLTETWHLIGRNLDKWSDLFARVSAGDIYLFEMTNNQVLRANEVQQELPDSEVDLADATLVAVAEALGTNLVATIDFNDFTFVVPETFGYWHNMIHQH